MIDKTKQVVFTNKAKCQDCYLCVRSCPVNAIKMENSQAQVIGNKCISCGTCVRVCPQNAKSYADSLDLVVNMLDNNEKIAVSIAPAFVVSYSEWQQKRLAAALRSIGFSHISETAVGAYHSAKKTAEYINENPNQSHICSACPAVVNYIEKYDSSLLNQVIPVVSPMIAHAKMLKKKLPGYKIVFVGPCIAKIAEARRPEFEMFVDAVLTFENMGELFQMKNVDISTCEESAFDEKPGKNSRLYPIEGGLLKTASLETDIVSQTIIAISGFSEISDAFESIKENPGNYVIEPLFCNNGCVNGPLIGGTRNKLVQKTSVIKHNDSNPENEEALIKNHEHLKTRFTKDESYVKPKFKDSEILEVLKKTGKDDPQNELNCEACGYRTCRDKAIAVLEGIAEVEMCIPYMRRLAEQKADLIIDKSPNGIIKLNRNLEIMQVNPAFQRMFSCSEAILGRSISYMIDPEPFEKLLVSEENVINQEMNYQSYNLVCHQICYSLPEKNEYIGVFVDITGSKQSSEKLQKIKTEMVLQAQELVDHQINMAQNLAQLLGENTAKGEDIMRQLIDAIEK